MKNSNKLKNIFKKFTANEIFKSSSVSISGAVIAQILAFATSPLISRMFTPSQIGEYGLYISTVSILWHLSAFKYDYAVATVEDSRKSHDLVYLSVIITVFITILSIPICIFLYNLDVGDSLKNWVGFLPISILILGIYNVANYYNVRLGNFKRITAAIVIRALALSLLQPLFAIIGFEDKALVIGYILSYFFGTNLLLFVGRFSKVKNVNRIKFTLKGLWVVLKEYRKFPFFVMPGAVANSITLNIQTYLIAYFYSVKQIGFYSLVIRLLSTPLTLITTSVSQVYLKYAVEANDKKSFQKIFGQMSKILMVISIPIFLSLFIWAKPIVTIFFGSQWEESVPIMKILIPLFAVRFIVTPFTSSGIIKGKQFSTMMWQLILLATSIIPAIVSMFIMIELSTFLIISTTLQSIAYIGFFLFTKKLSLAKER